MGGTGRTWRRARPEGTSATCFRRALAIIVVMTLAYVSFMSCRRLPRVTMVKRPDGMSAFEFAVLCGLRAAQLQRGCTPRVPPSAKVAVTAQHELAERKIIRSADTAESNSVPID